MTAVQIRPDVAEVSPTRVPPSEPPQFDRGRRKTPLSRWVMIAAAVLLAAVTVVWLRDIGRFNERTDDLKKRAVVAGASLGLSQNDINDAHQQLDTLNSKLAEAETTLAATRSEFASLESTHGEIDSAVRPMASALLDVESDLLELATTFDTTTSAFNAMTTTFDTAMGQGNTRDITTMVSTFATVKEAVSELNTGLDACTAQLADVRTKLAALSTTPPKGSSP